MGRLKIGAALATVQSPDTGKAPDWRTISNVANSAEAAGFDTVWIADELLWERTDGKHHMGWWECIALLGAVAATTSRVEVGSWVLSALHRNPGITVRAVETIDEISNGRFLFGLGAGHAGRQGEAFGLPSDVTVGRYVEALDIIVPLLREGSADFAGTYHKAVNLPNRPRGPQRSHIPLLLGGHGSRTIGIAVEKADIWSAFVTTGSEPADFEEMSELVDRTCDEQGRDRASLGRSVGIVIQRSDLPEPTYEAPAPPLKGTVDEIVAGLAGFADLGFTRVELLVNAESTADVERYAPIVEAARSI